MSAPRILATVCARAGSKGVPRKNLRPLAGLPLIVHTLLYAKASPQITDIVVSTDDPEIAELGKTYGADVPFLRPAEMANDAAPKMPVIRHAAEQMEALKGYRYDIVVDLDVTAPIRQPADLEGALDLLIKKKANAVLSVTPSAKNPYFNIAEIGNDGWAHISKQNAGPFFARQKAPQTYDLNGSIFGFTRDALEKATSAMMERTVLWVMDEKSKDVDREVDFQYLDLILRKNPV